MEPLEVSLKLKFNFLNSKEYLKRIKVFTSSFCKSSLFPVETCKSKMGLQGFLERRKTFKLLWKKIPHPMCIDCESPSCHHSLCDTLYYQGDRCTRVKYPTILTFTQKCQVYWSRGLVQGFIHQEQHLHVVDNPLGQRQPACAAHQVRG